MNAVNKIQAWGDSHHPAVLDIVRVLFGLFLLLKGCGFLTNLTYLERILAQQELANLSSGFIGFIMCYVIITHMVGGTLIALGICTRIAAIVQLPVVIAAIFILDRFQSPFNTEIWASVVATVLLLVFIVIGSGRFSLGRYLEANCPGAKGINN